MRGWHYVLALAAARTTSRLRAGAGDLAFDYSHHGEDWVQGSCASRERQSPIDFTSVHMAVYSTPGGVRGWLAAKL